MHLHIYVWCVSLQFSKKYGPVFTFYFGPQKVVVLVGYKIIKQALVNNSNVFSDRNIFPIMHDLKITHGKKQKLFCLISLYNIMLFIHTYIYFFPAGIVFANGESWKEMRNFALISLKSGKKTWEGKIIEESQHLIDILKEKDGNKMLELYVS